MKVLVLGAAVSGCAAARLGRSLGYGVAVYDRSQAALKELGAEQFAVHSGDWDATLLRNVALVVTSPGIPEHAPPVRDTLAAGIPLWSELEFAARQLQAPYAAVTGTNGKTTVAALTGKMLAAAGLRSAVAGNIGEALSDIATEPWDAVAVEASSFQLRFIDSFHPRAAAIMNVAPDHLDWHGSVAAYAAAKARIFENQEPGDVLVYDGDDPGARDLVAAAPIRPIPVSGRRLPEGGYGPVGDRLVLPGQSVARPDLDGAYLSDVVAAAVLAHTLGAGEDAIATAIAGFRPGLHRRTMVGTWDGVAWVDDSKATNPHAAEAAAGAYPAVVLIAGGRNKGLDLMPLAMAPSVRHIVAIGEAAADLEAAAPQRTTRAGSMEEAVAIADEIAVAGDTVLLAPGCASFDMFESYAARGEAFARSVRERKGAVVDRQ
jgi:UDP-N-acetylmuramoylalanine--D-glutamate ligase